MALNARQRRFYTHTVDTYRPSRLAGVDGEDGDVEALQVLVGLPCYVHTTTNSDDPQARVAQMKNDNQFTYDRLSCEAGADIKAGDWVKWNDDWYKVVGDPKVRVGTSVRTANRQQLFLTLTNKPIYRDWFEVLLGDEYTYGMGQYVILAEPLINYGPAIDRDLYVGGVAWLKYDGGGGQTTLTVTGLDEHGDEQTWLGSKPNGIVVGEVQMVCSRQGAYLTEITNMVHSGPGLVQFTVEARIPT